MRLEHLLFVYYCVFHVYSGNTLINGIIGLLSADPRLRAQLRGRRSQSGDRKSAKRHKGPGHSERCLVVAMATAGVQREA